MVVIAKQKKEIEELSKQNSGQKTEIDNLKKEKNLVKSAERKQDEIVLINDGANLDIPGNEPKRNENIEIDIVPNQLDRGLPDRLRNDPPAKSRMW